MTTSWPTKPYTGRCTQDPDTGRWDIRITAGNNRVTHTSHRQGYENYADAYAVLVHCLHGGPHVVRRPDGTFVSAPGGAWTLRRSWPFRRKPYTGTWWKRDDGKWDARITADTPNNDIVFTSHGQGFNNEQDVEIPLVHLLTRGPHVVLDIDGSVVPVGSVKPPSGRRIRKAVRRSAR